MCLSTAISEELYSKFERNACVEITDTNIFSQKILGALTRKRPPPFYEGKVNYYEDTTPPGNIWPQPEKITFTKLNPFKTEHEYRFAFSYTNAFDFQNIDLSLSVGEQKAVKRTYPEKTVKIKNISDICKVHIR